jgi:Na+/H+ antiporter NhaD/arsenite permease-like protein
VNLSFKNKKGESKNTSLASLSLFLAFLHPVDILSLEMTFSLFLSSFIDNFPYLLTVSLIGHCSEPSHSPASH